MTVCGVDPGNQGAFVVTDGKDIFEYAFMPLKEEGKNKSIDFRLLMDHFDKFRSGNIENKIQHFFLERAVSFGMGLSGAFSYGRGFGFIEIAISLSEIPVTQVSPAQWTKEMHEGISSDLKPKVKSVIAAERLFPQIFDRIPMAVTGKTKGKKHEGVIDALLIAGYGLRKLGG